MIKLKQGEIVSLDPRLLGRLHGLARTTKDNWVEAKAICFSIYLNIDEDLTEHYCKSEEVAPENEVFSADILIPLLEKLISNSRLLLELSPSSPWALDSLCRHLYLLGTQLQKQDRMDEARVRYAEANAVKESPLPLERLANFALVDEDFELGLKLARRAFELSALAPARYPKYLFPCIHLDIWLAAAELNKKN